MATRIVVLLDGSILAENALPYALALAERLPADLTLLRLIPLSSGEAEQEEAKAYLRAVASALTDPSLATPVDAERVHVRVSRDEPEHAIRLLALLGRADMVVMTTHGRSGLSRLIMGSTAAHVIEHGGVPVLVIRSEHSDTTRPLSDRLREVTPFAHGPVIVALDGNSDATFVLERARLFAQAFSLPLHMLRVVSPVPPVPAFGESGMIYLHDTGTDTDAEVAEARLYLDKLAGALQENGQKAGCIVRVGTAAECITAYVYEEKAAMVAMATHAPGIVDQFIRGSVAGAVVRHTSVPVLLIHIADYVKEGRGHEGQTDQSRAIKSAPGYGPSY